MMTSQESQTERDQQLQQTQLLSSARFPKWIALAVLSLVAWFSVLLERHSMNSSEKWALSVTTLSMVFGIMGALCYLYSRGLFMGQLPEVALAGVILVIWAAGLPVIMNPQNSIAVGYTQVENANLYFASWGAFLCILWISGSLGKELYGLDIAGMATPLAKTKRGKYYALVAASLVVLGASIRVFKAFKCTEDAMQQAPTCRKTKFAISAGVIGTVDAALTTLLAASGRMSQPSEWCGSLVMLIIWCFGLGYITFGSGPGHSIGNLYFATWACFVLSVLLCAESYMEYLGHRERGMGTMNEDAEEVPEDLALEEVPVSDFDGDGDDDDV